MQRPLKSRPIALHELVKQLEKDEMIRGIKLADRLALLEQLASYRGMVFDTGYRWFEDRRVARRRIGVRLLDTAAYIRWAIEDAQEGHGEDSWGWLKLAEEELLHVEGWEEVVKALAEKREALLATF